MPEKRPPEDIVHGVPPVAVSSTTTQANRTGSWKYIRPVFQDLVAPCNATCAVGVDMEGCMNFVREGRLKEARELLLRENPMPATCGRICDHPCETTCNRASMDGAVAVHSVERMLGDLAIEDPLPPPAPRTRKERVAVIGSGPAGLACAYHLVRLGYEVMVFESDAAPGGALRYRVPEYRLPRRILDREIQRIVALGAEIRCGVRLGRQLSWKELEQFDAVFLATGAHRSRSLGVEGEGMPGVRYGLDFLHEVHSGRAPELGARVAVIGGDFVAVDCARTAVRLGSQVTVVFSGTPEQLGVSAAEVREAEDEGVIFQFLTLPMGVKGFEEPPGGDVESLAREIFAESGAGIPEPPRGLDCVRMTLDKPDGYGGDPVPAYDGRHVLAADTVIVAVGEEADLDFLPRGPKPDEDLEAALAELNRRSKTAVFAGGGILEEPHTIAHALGSGKRVAICMDHHLRTQAGEKPAPLHEDGLRYGRVGNLSITRYRGDDPIRRQGDSNEVARADRINLAHFMPMASRVERLLPAAERVRGFEEVRPGLTPAEAEAEARRCFNCGVCTQCEMCLVFCPDAAITRRDGDARFSISYKYCKGCGVCSLECPRGAISMTREGL